MNGILKVLTAILGVLAVIACLATIGIVGYSMTNNGNTTPNNQYQYEYQRESCSTGICRSDHDTGG